jgi:hypothetical protein
MKRLLVFEIDGVLHNLAASPVIGHGGLMHTPAQFSRRVLFEAWLLSRPDVDVAIVSMWAAYYPLERLARFFDEKLRSRFVAAIGVNPGASKSPSVEQLAIRFDGPHLIIVDHDSRRYDEQHHDLAVWVDPTIGIGPSAFNAIDAAMGVLKA